MNFFIPVHAGNGVLHSTRMRERVSTYSSDSNRGNHGIYNISICCRYIQQASCVVKSMLYAILLIDGSYLINGVSLGVECLWHSVDYCGSELKVINRDLSLKNYPLFHLV